MSEFEYNDTFIAVFVHAIVTWHVPYTIFPHYDVLISLSGKKNVHLLLL